MKNPGTILPSGRFGSADSTQPKNVVVPEKPYMQYRARHWGNGKVGAKMPNGSGMRAVFLGGARSKNGSSGTGVFLPRVNNDPAELKKKSGTGIYSFVCLFRFICLKSVTLRLC